MPVVRTPTAALEEVLALQSGTISRRQALLCGLSDHAIAHRRARGS